ncbi:MAG TPA: FN3 associated domain-containing protein, partial [Rectinemataceae bacterium]|nr:FN3 associated domain-containing protein [Rectinemataceae bacterium]
MLLMSKPIVFRFPLLVFVLAAGLGFLAACDLIPGSGGTDPVVPVTPTIEAPATRFEASSHAPSVIVSLTSSLGASIYYTLNGTTPSSASIHYNAPFSLKQTTRVKAIAVNSSGASSIATQLFLFKRTTQELFSTDGTVTERMDYHYDPAGYFCDCIEDYQGSPLAYFQKFVYTYDPATGKRARRDTYNASNVLTGYRTFSFDSTTGRNNRRDFYNASG